MLSGANDSEIGGVDVVSRPALAATIADMLDADGYLFGTAANFGNMSGALKHFFDTVYYPILDHVSGRSYGLWVHGNNDTVGARGRRRQACYWVVADSCCRRAGGRQSCRCHGVRTSPRSGWHACRDANGMIGRSGHACCH